MEGVSDRQCGSGVEHLHSMHEASGLLIPCYHKKRNNKITQVLLSSDRKKYSSRYMFTQDLHLKVLLVKHFIF